MKSLWIILLGLCLVVATGCGDDENEDGGAGNPDPGFVFTGNPEAAEALRQDLGFAISGKADLLPHFRAPQIGLITEGVLEVRSETQVGRINSGRTDVQCDGWSLGRGDVFELVMDSTGPTQVLFINGLNSKHTLSPGVGSNGIEGQWEREQVITTPNGTTINVAFQIYRDNVEFYRDGNPKSFDITMVIACTPPSRIEQQFRGGGRGHFHHPHSPPFFPTHHPGPFGGRPHFWP